MSEFNIIIEKDSEGLYVASVPELYGCHTQASNIDELVIRAKEAIELCIEEYSYTQAPREFIGIQRVTI
jgi:predicted RNase H-like HicB family nuclease